MGITTTGRFGSGVDCGSPCEEETCIQCAALEISLPATILLAFSFNSAPPDEFEVLTGEALGDYSCELEYLNTVDCETLDEGYTTETGEWTSDEDGGALVDAANIGSPLTLDLFGAVNGYGITVYAHHSFLTAGQVLYLKLNDNDSNTDVLDYSVSGNNGTLSGAGNTSGSHHANGLIFDGDNDVVTLDSELTLDVPYTLFWSDDQDSGSGDDCVLKGVAEPTEIRLTSGTLTFINRSGSGPVISATTDGALHSRCLRSQADGTLDYYEDGILAVHVGAVGTYGISIAQLSKSDTVTHNLGFNGKLANLRVFDVALSDSEVEAVSGGGYILSNTSVYCEWNYKTTETYEIPTGMVTYLGPTEHEGQELGAHPGATDWMWPDNLSCVFEEETFFSPCAGTEVWLKGNGPYVRSPLYGEGTARIRIGKVISGPLAGKFFGDILTTVYVHHYETWPYDPVDYTPLSVAFNGEGRYFSDMSGSTAENIGCTGIEVGMIFGVTYRRTYIQEGYTLYDTAQDVIDAMNAVSDTHAAPLLNYYSDGPYLYGYTPINSTPLGAQYGCELIYDYSDCVDCHVVPEFGDPYDVCVELGHLYEFWQNDIHWYGTDQITTQLTI